MQPGFSMMNFVTVLMIFTSVTNVCGLSNGQILLEDGYNKNALPRNDKKPVQVVLTTHLQNIINVNEEKQVISVDISLRLVWKDERVSLNESFHEYLERDRIGEYFNINPSEVEELWLPDVYIPDSIEIRHPKYMAEPTSLRVYKDQRLRLNKRFNLDLGCNMDFHKFPLDTQTCFVYVESWKYGKNALIVKYSDKYDIVFRRPRLMKCDVNHYARSSVHFLLALTN